MSNYFEELYAVPVTEHIEKKNGFSYVSWPFAVAELRRRHPDATWEVRRFEGQPFMVSPFGVFVEVAVTVNGITLSQIHPVLDHMNRPVPEPNAFQVNTSIQRCLVKAIALHGLGLHVYAGEDLPGGTDTPAAPKTPPRPPGAPKKATPAPKPGPVATQDQIKRFLDQIQPVAEAATKWAYESGLIKADQTIYDMEDKHFPTTKGQVDKILWDIQRIMDGPETPEPPTDGKSWRDFVLPFGKEKGKRLGDVPKNYLWGMCENYTVATEYNGKPKRPETIAKDQALRDALDAAKAELFEQPAQ